MKKRFNRVPHSFLDLQAAGESLKCPANKSKTSSETHHLITLDGPKQTPPASLAHHLLGQGSHKDVNNALISKNTKGAD